MQDMVHKVMKIIYTDFTNFFLYIYINLIFILIKKELLKSLHKQYNVINQ